MVSQSERDYLLVEFSNSFQHMGKLDDRRYEILQFYSTFITAVFAAVVAIVGLNVLHPSVGTLGAAIVLLSSAGVSWSMGRVLSSERKATERYRNKLNAIRKVLLSDERSPAVDEFVGSGGEISIGLERIEGKDLRFLDIFKEDRRCTALYIKVLTDVGMWTSLFGSVILAMYALVVLQ